MYIQNNCLFFFKASIFFNALSSCRIYNGRSDYFNVDHERLKRLGLKSEKNLVHWYTIEKYLKLGLNVWAKAVHPQQLIVQKCL